MTIGRFSPLDICDYNVYAHDQHTAGGLDISDGDGTLNYGWERILEVYYDFPIGKNVHGALDYQFITDPAFNRDRGPVSVFGARIHWEF